MGKDLFNDRISRFSIRKLNVGVCSVLLGTLVMVGTASQVSADETANQVQAGDVASTTATVSDETSSQNAVATQASTEVANFLSSSETNSQSQTVSNASAATSETSTTQASSETTSQAASSTSASTAASTTSVAGSTSVGNTTGVSTTASVTPASSETTASETASEAQGVDVQAEASTTNALSSGDEASALEQPVVTAETSGRRRTRRAIGDPNDESLIGDDVEDATSTPKVEKTTEFSKINAKELVKQINWLDFGDTTAWTNTTTSKDGRTALQVGSTYTKEIMPGYIVNIKVKSLKPFQATEIYKNRMEAQGATEAEKATYDPNAKNGYIGTIGDPTTRAAFANREEALVVADAQNRWTEIRQEGIDTGSKRTTISSEYNGANIGVQFEISATFRGKSVKPAVVAADGESANPGELVLFTTNGAGWKHIGEWKKASNTETYVVQDTHNYFDPANNYSRSKFVDVNGARISGLNLELLRNANEVGPDKKPVAWKYFGSPDQVTGGLGTGVFGPNVSASRFSVPLVMTQGASEVGLYIASSGKQSAMLGFFPLDEGDAPESYGKAQHSIGTVDGVTGTKLAQPYLGTVSPDMDENNANDWTGDDNTISADEGVDQIVPDNLKGQTNDMIKLDRTRPGTYTLDVEAHTDGAAKAYVYGWIDFNQNGTFDEDERSDLATVTKDGTVRLEFRNAKTMIDPSVTELGTRVRIASNQSDIENPTGLALSGEVEDFKTQITFPPKGERKETIDVQGATQTATVAFTAQGLSKYSRDKNAEIDQTVAPVIIDNRTKQVVNPKADGYYVIPGEGKYKITPNGNNIDIEFTPEDNFVGTASGISIRRTDDNGYTTDWVSKDKTLLPSINEVMDNMDGLYIPTVTPKNIEGEDKKSTDVQGASQTGTPEFALEGTNSNGEKVKITPDFDYPAKFVDPATGNVINDPVLTVEGEGIYYLDELTGKVTFVPEPGFTGTAKGVTVSLTAPVGRDKDGRVPDNALKTATAKYTPTVTPITVTPTDKVSADVQNVPQTQTPTFDLSNDKTAEITSKKLVDPATGQPTDETTVTVAGEGSYTIDPTTGAVTFTPEKDFVGTAKGVTVQATATITNANGKTTTITSDATYTPTVVAAVPTAQPATSKDIQGATQTGTPTFAGTTVQVNGEDKAITIKDNSYTLLDNDGNEVTSTPAYAADGTTEIGTYSIDSATGQVTFTPTDKSYTGAVTPAKVQAESSNGIKVDTTYTPEIVPVTPTSTPAETTDIQGATQTGKPEFKGGTVTVDGVEKTVAINEDVPATFDDGSTTKTVDGVGTYTVAADGTVTFVPEKSFVGTAPAVTVVREDKNGTKASATYTPTVTPVTPTAEDTTSTGKQGQTQTGKPEFTEGDSRVPMNDDVPATFDDGSTTKTVDGVGTYTVAADGTVTFVPEKSFTGTAPAVTVVREDKNGTKASATYTPTVTPVTPTATPAESEAPQGVVQTGTVTFTEGDPVAPIDKDTITLLDETGQPVASVEAKSPAGDVIGTFTVDKETGVVTFTPTDKSYSGDVVPVKVQAADTNGTTVETTYTPKITPVVPTAEPATSTDIQGKTQTGTPSFTPGNPAIPMDDDVPATFEDGSTTKTIPGEGTYTVAPDGTVTFVPEKSFTGEGTGVTVKRVDKNGTEITAKYTPTVTPVTPTATPVETTGKQGQTQTGKPEFTEGDSRVPMNDDVPATFDDGSTTKTVDGVGTYTVAADGTVTFVPEKSFTGKAPTVTVVREDKNGTKASATYTPTVTPVTPTATPAESTGPQGLVQTGTVTFTEGDPVAPIDKDTITLLDETGQPAASVDAKSPAGDVIGTFTVDKETGVVTFTPTDKSYSGDVVPVKVQAADTNGTTVETTYTLKITPVVPTSEDATTTDIQGATQTGKPTFTEGNPNVPIDEDTPATFEDGSTTKTVDGEGTYTVAPDGTVTFVPEKSFTGTATGVTVKRVDKNGTEITAKYTPTVTPVTPTATPVETTDIQGATQTGKPVFTEGDSRVPMNDDVPATFDDGSTTKTVDGVGTYTVAADGTVTFVPEKSFVGTAPAVTVVREDKNGTKASATYTPTVTPVTPTAEDTTSTDKQGQTQTGTPTFTPGNPNVPMDDDTPATFEDGSTTKTVPGEGTYTVAPDGTVTFVPEKSFTGTGTGVTVKRVDKNGTPVTAKYTPTVTPVTPTATPAESTGPQGLVQTGTVTFTEGDPVAPIDKDTITLLDENGQPAESVVAKSPEGKEIGTFTVDKETGVVTFTPTDKSYSGDVVPVKVQAADTNGTTVETTYTPKITPVVPTAEPATSTDIQGATQTGKPTFTEGDPNVPIDEDTPATFEDGSTTKTVDGEGTYTVSPDGTVTFVPEKSFTGTASGVTVKRVDKNGTEITAKYTPTVTPVTPTAEDTTSTGKQGQTQTGKPEFTEGDSRVPMNDDVPATFEDGSTTKTVDGVGTYTVASDGTVTFVPEKSFTGEAPAVTVVREDKNGTKASATYTPTVTPVTPTATPVETTGKQGQTQTGKPVFTEGDSRVPMNDDVPATFDDGSTTKTVDGVGTYTVAADGTVTFVPEKSFTGKAPAVTVVREDKNGTKASAAYTPTVTPVTPTATPAESTGPQGLVQTGTVTFTEGDPVAPIDKDTITLLDENGQPAASVEAKSPAGDVIGTFTVDKETGVVTFTPTDKSYSGDVVPVKVQAADANGTTVETTYTPKITPVVPTSEDATSTDIQGATQTGKPTFTEGNPNVPIDEDTPATFEDGSTTKTVDGEGTYTVSPDGTVTFVPEKSFTGTGSGVTVKRVDKNGTEITAKYTPTVTPVTPTAEDSTSTGKQGQTQTGKPKFTEGNSRVPMNDDVPATFDDGSTTKTVDGVGTYTVAADGTVTFVPEKSFTGEAPAVTVVREDMNGTKASAKYTPTVTPVTPTAEPATSTDIQGATQTGKPEFTEGDSRVPMNDDVPATFDDGSTTKTVDGVGTYTVAADGTVTFVPEKSFTGTAPAVTVVREDKNGTKASATYTPTVTPVTPTAEDTTSTDKQGQTQTGTPSFTPGNPNVPMDDDTPATFEDGSTTKTIPGEGTYTVAPDGTVTFVPEKSFTGEGSGVTVKRVDKNGTPVTAKYTPTVTPVTPTATPAESEAPQGVVQTGTVTFTEGDPVAPIDKDTITLLDENGQPAASVDAKSPAGDVIGTFTVDKETGVVTFTPTDKSYSGDVVPVKVQGKDTNGTVAETTYTPKITPVVSTADPATSTDIQGQTQTGTPSFTPGNPAISMDDDTPATFDDGSTTKTIPGEGTYTVAPNGTVTFVPEKSFTGEGTGVTVKRVDKNGTPVTATYTPTVTPVTPTAEPTTSTGKQGQTQTGKPEFTEGDSRVPMNDDVPATFEDGTTTKTVDGVGTYTVAADGTVTFVPEKSFVGTAPAVTVVREDVNGTKASATYTPTVTSVTPTATPAESTGPQGVVQTGTVTFTEGDSVAPIDKDTITLLDENGQPAAAVFAKSPAGNIIGTFTVDKDTGVVTFTPTDKSYSGDVVPVKVQAADTNGTTVETTYTPKITPVVPTSEDATSTDIQGATQTGKPTFTEGDPNVPIDEDTPATFEDGSTTKTVDGEGTYTVSPEGTVTFVPEKSFTGTATGVTVKRVDKNGTEITAKYTPTVTPVTPTAAPAESTDIQGATQTGKPEFTEGDSRVPMNDDVPATFDDGSTTKTVEGVGTYTVAADGTVTFVPEKSFTGTAPAVTVVREDMNGTKASATYIPTVTPVTPTATPAVSTDIQGATQTGKPVFTEGDSRVPMNDDVPATFDDGSTTKTVEGVGTYTVAVDGTVTFVPEKSFVGEAPAVTVVREDVNGTKASATYTPTVTPVTPTGEPATSTDIQGQTQTGKPSFTPGNPSVPMDDDVPATFEDGSTTKVIPGEGTYTVASDGTVTFVPEKAFTGTGTGVTVKRVDKNGTAITATYTPTVTPVTPTAESVTSIGNKGQTQTGKPNFTEGDSRVPMNNQVPATFEDGSTTKTISGVGTYTVAADGTVTFTPEPEFTGTAPAVTVVREDVNGTKASATYTPTVLPITKFVDKEGKEIPGYPTVDGEQPKVEIPGYRFVETKKLPNGDIEHVYEQVTTSYVDENGTPIPGYPTEDGQQPKKDIPGYEFVKTVVDENGNTQHIYKQIVTPTPVPDTTPTPEPQPAPQTEEPKAPVLPETKEEAHFINPTDKTAQLPETGSEDSNLAIFGLASLLAGFGLYGTKRRKR
ncbi:GEVED domain-containing protein [Streptococcus salivarius]